MSFQRCYFLSEKKGLSTFCANSSEKGKEIKLSFYDISTNFWKNYFLIWILNRNFFYNFHFKQKPR